MFFSMIGKFGIFVQFSNCKSVTVEESSIEPLQ